MKRTRLWIPLACVAMIAAANGGCSGADAGRKDSHPGNRSREAEIDAAPQRQNQPLPEAGAAAETETAQIESVSISPLNPNLDSTVSVTAKTNPAELPEALRLEYVYWINAAVAARSADNTFPMTGRRKMDLFYVDACLFQGDRELSRKRSTTVRIVNRSPVIRNIEFPKTIEAGIYRILVDAFDPDGDPITYALEGGELPEGAKVDSAGVIDIPVPPPATAKETVFLVAVKDNDNGETRNRVRIGFGQKKTQPEE